MCVEVVIARYTENLDFVNRLPANTRVSVYDKSKTDEFGSRSTNVKVEKLGNVGREPHSYARYILDRYETLPDVVVFMQGNPRDHTGATSDSEIADWVSRVAEQALSGGLSTHGVAAHEAGCNSATSNFRIVYPDLEQCEGNKDLGTWYEKCCNEKFPETGAVWCMGACFAASRENLLSVSKETWRRFYDSFCYSSAPVTAHYMERAWHTLLSNRNQTEKTEK